MRGGPLFGIILKNTNYGVYGTLNNLGDLSVDVSKALPVALKDDIVLGKAEMISTIDGGQPKSYEVMIEKIYTNNNIDNKSMVVRITDKELLEKTGGIVQGMSGSPIIQNGKLIRSFNPCYGK